MSHIASQTHSPSVTLPARHTASQSRRQSVTVTHTFNQSHSQSVTRSFSHTAAHSLTQSFSHAQPSNHTDRLSHCQSVTEAASHDAGQPVARAINHTFRQSYCLSDSVSRTATQSHINKYHSQRVTHTQSVTVPDTCSELRGHAVTHQAAQPASYTASQTYCQPCALPTHAARQPVSHTAIHSLTQSVSHIQSDTQ